MNKMWLLELPWNLCYDNFLWGFSLILVVAGDFTTTKYMLFFFPSRTGNITWNITNIMSEYYKILQGIVQAKDPIHKLMAAKLKFLCIH